MSRPYVLSEIDNLVIQKNKVYEIMIVPEVEGEEIGSIDIALAPELCRSESEFLVFKEEYGDWDVIPFKAKELYKRRYSNAEIVTVHPSSLFLRISGQFLDKSDLVVSNALVTMELVDFQSGVKVIGLDKDYNLDDLKYYWSKSRPDNYEYIDPGILLNEKARYIRQKYRRRLKFLLLHLFKYQKLPDLKKILLNIINYTTNVTKLEVSIMDLYRLKLFITDIIPEYNSFVRTDTRFCNVIEEMLQLEWRSIKSYARANITYIDLLKNGTNFINNWRNFYALYDIIRKDRKINSYPLCVVDYLSNFTRIEIANNQRETLEKLICTILAEDLQVAVKYLSGIKIKDNRELITSNYSPPTKLYEELYGITDLEYCNISYNEYNHTVSIDGIKQKLW